MKTELTYLTQDKVTYYANQVYQMIGHDLQDGRDGDIHRDDLIDIVLDHMFSSIYHDDMSPMEIDEWTELPLEDKVEMLKKAFPFEWYE
jgi:hypothetical protein